MELSKRRANGQECPFSADNQGARAELTYEVLASSDLVTWTVIATNPGAVSPTEPVTVTDPASVSTNPRRFLRLRVSP